MKKNYLIILVLVSIFTILNFSSCSKEDNVTDESILGTWEGTSLENEESMVATFSADGKITGTWYKNSYNFTGQYENFNYNYTNDPENHIINVQNAYGTTSYPDGYWEPLKYELKGNTLKIYECFCSGDDFVFKKK